MADAGQQDAAPVRGGRGRGRGRGNFGGLSRPQGSFMDPEHPAFLQDKWSKKLGRDLASIEVKYTATGFTVVLTGMENTRFAALQGGSIADYHRLAAEANAQTPEQKLAALRRKYEDRVGAAPGNFPTVWGDQAVEAWINALPLEGRRRLRMSQKQWRDAAANPTVRPGNGLAPVAEPPA